MRMLKTTRRMELLGKYGRSLTSVGVQLFEFLRFTDNNTLLAKARGTRYLHS